MNQKITVEKKGHVLLIGINRPEKRNAFDVDMYWDLAKAYGALDADDDIRCGVLFAHGDHFTGGLDLVQWVEPFSKGEFPTLPSGSKCPFGMDEDNRVSKPIVAALQGICFTVGWELMLATDIRVAASNLRLAQIEVKRGIYPVGGATVRLFEEIGWGNAMRYLLTGDEMNAQEAYRLGLVQELVEPGQQVHRAVEIAETIAKQAPLGVRAIIRSARLSRVEGAKTALGLLLPHLLPIMTSEDAQEGVRAFIERREANFTGK